MNWFYDLKIGKKLILGFAIVIVMACFLGIFSIAQLVKVNNASTDIATNWLPSITAGGQMQTSLARFRISESTHIMSAEESEMTATEKSLATRLEIFRKQQAVYAALVSETEEKRIYPELEKTIEDYLSTNKKMLALSREGKKMRLG